MKMIGVSVCGACPWIARDVWFESIKKNVTICGAFARYREVDLNSIPLWCPLESVPDNSSEAVPKLAEKGFTKPGQCPECGAEGVVGKYHSCPYCT